MYTLAPSVYAADIMHLYRQLNDVKEMGITCLHVDIMDGCFVPLVSFGSDVVRAVKECLGLRMDIHLMVDNPEKVIEEYIDAGADAVIFHLEATDNAVGLLDKIHRLGADAGIALKPETDLSKISEGIWRRIDVLQLMTAEPGMKGQHFQCDMVKKIAKARGMINEMGRDISIEIDGDITQERMQVCLDAGASIIVVGKAIFNGDVQQNVNDFLRYNEGVIYEILNRN